MRYDALGAVSCSSASRHGTFTRTEATTAGLDRRTIRKLLDDGTLREPFPGVLAWISSGTSWEQQLAAASLARGGALVASHRSAARLHGFDGFAAAADLEFSATRRVRLPGVLVHEAAALELADRVLVNGIPCTGIARTLCDLGSVVPADRVERALDGVRRAGVSLRWLRETAQRLHRPSQAGTGTLLRLLDVAAADPRLRDSWFEALIERLLRDPRIPPLDRQFTVVDDHARFVARVDLAIPHLRLAIEAQSREFHFGVQAEGRDEDRDHRLVAAGWDTLYLGQQSLRRPSQTVQLVADVVAARAALLGARAVPARRTT